MEIKTSGQNSLSVLLKYEDMKSLHITISDFTSKTGNARRAIMNILEKARQQGSYLDMKGKIVVEISPLLDGGCYILFTAVSKAKVKKSAPVVLEFDSSENLCRAMDCLKTMKPLLVKSGLYNKDRKYRVIIYNTSQAKNFLPLFLEFSNIFKGDLAVASTKEYWHEITCDNAFGHIS